MTHVQDHTVQITRMRTSKRTTEKHSALQAPAHDTRREDACCT